MATDSQREKILKNFGDSFKAITKATGFNHDIREEQVYRRLLDVKEEQNPTLPAIGYTSGEDLPIESTMGWEPLELRRQWTIIVGGYVKTDDRNLISTELEWLSRDIIRKLLEDRGRGLNAEDTQIGRIDWDESEHAAEGFGVLEMEVIVVYRFFDNAP